MAKQVLITGGAGFIGSHLADELLAAGYAVRVLDNLSEQVHGRDRIRPDYLDPEVELLVGDVRDMNMLRKCLCGVDAVFHFAAMVGVGQSMYQVRDYVDVNETGTAALLQKLTTNPVERLIVASSMSIYGEGLYLAPDGRLVEDACREGEALRQGRWECCDRDGAPLVPMPTPESKRPCLASVYALSKYAQERMCHMVGASYGIETVGLRFFNVYGTRQALSNPYTGVLAIFASRLLNGKSPMIFEDGRQRRDFVHVADVARACRLALEKSGAAGKVFNIGSGNSYSVRELAEGLGAVLGSPLEPEITGKCRVGDIRHCFADTSLARNVLGFKPQVELSDGLAELADWLAGQQAVDKFDDMAKELSGRGLTI
ncbi:nucleoside-diphosphate-sugar epimerase [Desulfocurvibacter africanus PCS]|uniref:Nucleoside-diphosphate-sugar epimerase n=1 Tax=Desulfocurvibacter africanus PCS TaxID=1262666 RepID=M5PNE9_DESAF|nr:NAD-dependent epimerase/dehydratase family protein [Desulfocurvibacter africanus]EMG35622.1 nucleoside-diphosphate-sugar epimerase [Desulfocurvibacter africanus PCS]